MDTAQVILLSVVGILTLLLVVLGVQVFFILKEIKHTLSRANHVLDSASVISDTITRPIESLTSILSGVKIGSLITAFLEKKRKKTKE